MTVIICHCITEQKLVNPAILVPTNNKTESARIITYLRRVLFDKPKLTLCFSPVSKKIHENAIHYKHKCPSSHIIIIIQISI